MTLVATDGEASEEGPDTATFTVMRSGPTTDPLTVQYGLISTTGSPIPGEDFDAFPGSITIQAGETSANITLTPIDDSDPEGPETVVLSLIADPAYELVTPRIANAVIADNDVPVVTLTASNSTASEVGLETGEFTVTRSRGNLAAFLDVVYTIDGTASNGFDYTSINGFVRIPANATSATVAITPRGDNLVEGAETVILTLETNPAYNVGTPATDTVTIADSN